MENNEDRKKWLIFGLAISILVLVTMCFAAMMSKYNDSVDPEDYDTDPPAINEEDINENVTITPTPSEAEQPAIEYFVSKNDEARIIKDSDFIICESEGGQTGYLSLNIVESKYGCTYQGAINNISITEISTYLDEHHLYDQVKDLTIGQSVIARTSDNIQYTRGQDVEISGIQFKSYSYDILYGPEGFLAEYYFSYPVNGKIFDVTKVYVDPSLKEVFNQYFLQFEFL